MKSQRAITLEQLKEVFNDHQNPNLIWGEIEKKHGFSRTYLKKMLIKNGYVKEREYRFNKVRKLPIDETVFDSIDTEQKAYFLGIFMADGSVSVLKTGKYFRLGLVDLEMIEKYKKFLSSEHKIHVRPKKDENHQLFYNLTIGNDKLVSRLIEMGAIENKSNRTKIPSEVPENLINHFIRGYFDGDGNWAFKGTKNGLRITSCSVEVLSQIQDCLIKNKILRDQNYIFIDKRSKGNFPTYYLDIGKQSETKAFGDFIYKNSTVFLERKLKTFNTIKVGDKIENIKHIAQDLERKDLSIFELEVIKYDDEIKFKIYWDVPKDCYKIV